MESSGIFQFDQASNESPPSHTLDSSVLSKSQNMPTPLQTIANSVGALLKESGETVSIAESSTGGLISAALLAVSGASAYFVGGSVVYTAPARDLYLGIDLDNHPGMRSASDTYALLLAKTSREKLETVWGLSETGAAGPTGNRYGNDAGHTCIAISSATEESVQTLETGISDRKANMQTYAEKALQLFERYLRNT